MKEQRIVRLSDRGSYDGGDVLHDDVQKKLPQFIVENVELIVKEWEEFAGSIIPPSSEMSPLALRDHIHEILTFFVFDIQTKQTTAEEVAKSHGKAPNDPHATAAEAHASLRLAGGFDMGQMISEYRALRASIIKLWRKSCPAMDEADFLDMARFNESVDQALAESAAFYSKHTLRSKDMFVAVLSHDIRNPLQSIMSSAELLGRLGSLNDKQAMLSGNILACVSRINGLADNLLDVTRARLGASLSIVRQSMNMGLVGHQILDEMRQAHPQNTFRIDLTPDLSGFWDKARVGQVLANLLSNAVQHGFGGYPITLHIQGDVGAVTIEVHNQGKSIEPDRLGGLFDPLTRATSDLDDKKPSFNLGLGLYISHEIVVAHGGKIIVTSSQNEGTRFKAIFPRYPASDAAAA
jgi:signal transduction histidine kinase